ncbi:unnamed protein product [Allacma fusca]|uniref:Uncharacterized protein n=1 Tax=Allacma fusca TaxID=39272 RepID=A0A8J2NZZ0_9HEXA|nr:unnamed protein product [Allacma fusca]
MASHKTTFAYITIMIILMALINYGAPTEFKCSREGMACQLVSSSSDQEPMDDCCGECVKDSETNEYTCIGW